MKLIKSQIGLIDCQIPIKSLFQEPTIIEISDVTLTVLVNQSSQKTKAHSPTEEQNQLKQTALLSFEKSLDAKGFSDKKSSQTPFLMRQLKKLQVKVSNVNLVLISETNEYQYIMLHLRVG